MPRTSAASQIDAALCDPRCTLHVGTKVSRSVRKRCARELDIKSMKQAASASRATIINQTSPHIPSNSSTTPLRSLNFAARVASSIVVASDRFESQGGFDDIEDVTMPTLGVGWDSLYYGGQDGSSQSDNAELLDEPNSTEPNHDNEPSSRSSTPDLETASNPPDYEFSPTEYDYSSGSEADIDTDNEMPSIFDNLHRISPASSPRPTPHACSPEGSQYAENEQYINPPFRQPNPKLIHLLNIAPIIEHTAKNVLGNSYA